MPYSQIQTVLRSEIKKKNISERSDSSIFLIWFLEKYYELDEIDAISCVCDNKNDKGIDWIFVDEYEEEIHIFQSKLKSINDGTIGDKVLREFMGVKEWFDSSDSVNKLLQSTINDELKNLIINLNLVNIIDDYEVKYCFLENAMPDHNTKEYQNTTSDLIIYDLDYMASRYHIIQDDPLVRDSVEIIVDSAKDRIEGSIDSEAKFLMISLKASELLKFKGLDDFTLFNKNVRYGLGNTRVNKEIQKTLKDNTEKSNFLLYHNGISLVCEKFERSEKKITITNYSIVNGDQSTLTFYNNKSLLNDDVKIFLRIIEVGNSPELMDKITKYNNNQNAISMRDLRSNDKVQLRLVRQFQDLNKKYSINVAYISKRGTHAVEDEVITSDYAAQLIESCHLNQSYRAHLKSSMFDSRYNDIFNRTISAFKILMYFDAAKILEGLIEEKKLEDRRIATYGLVKLFLLSVLFKILDEKKVINTITAERYINKRDAYKGFFEYLLTLIINFLNHKVKSDVNILSDYKNYFKLKESVESLSSKIHSDLDSAFIMNNISFDKKLEEYMQ